MEPVLQNLVSSYVARVSTAGQGMERHLWTQEITKTGSE